MPSHRLLALVLLTAVTVAPAQVPPEDDEAPVMAARGGVADAGADDLKQQLADALELNDQQRDQLDQTLSRAEAAEEARDRLQREQAALQEQLAAARRELELGRRDRDNLAADARNLAAELRNTRAERERYQRQAVEAGERNASLLASLQHCVDRASGRAP